MIMENVGDADAFEAGEARVIHYRRFLLLQASTSPGFHAPGLLPLRSPANAPVLGADCGFDLDFHLCFLLLSA